MGESSERNQCYEDIDHSWKRKGENGDIVEKITTLCKKSHLSSSSPDGSRLDDGSCKRDSQETMCELQFMRLEWKYSLVNYQITGIQCLELRLPGTVLSR